MRSIYFLKRGDSETYFRCGLCKADVPHMRGGVNVQVANQVVAIVCFGCFQKATDAVSTALPHSFPDLDEHGILLP